MELVMGAFTSLAAGIGTAVPALAPAMTSLGTALGGATGAASTVAGVLQGTAGLAGAMSALRAGQAQSAAYQAQAADTRLDVEQESIDAMGRQTSLRKQLVASLGERDTAYAASGADLSFGTPQVARAEAIAAANEAIARDQSTSDVRKSRLRGRAATLTAMATDAEDAAATKAWGLGLGTAASIIARG